MPKRSSKKGTPKDTNELAYFIAKQATADPEEPPRDKNPHAVALDRLGGLKGGKVRAERLTPEQRREISKKAATTRWHKGDV